MTLGFVVGKFYPPHRGHKHLIDTARAQVDRLVVLVPHHPSQRIPGELRRDWLREIHIDHHAPSRLVDLRETAARGIRLGGKAPRHAHHLVDGGFTAQFIDGRTLNLAID